MPNGMQSILTTTTSYTQLELGSYTSESDATYGTIYHDSESSTGVSSAKVIFLEGLASDFKAFIIPNNFAILFHDGVWYTNNSVGSLATSAPVAIFDDGTIYLAAYFPSTKYFHLYLSSSIRSSKVYVHVFK